MNSTTPIQKSTSDLCIKALCNISDLACACALTANDLTGSTTNDLSNAPAMLRSIYASLRALEIPLTLLRSEIESGLPLEDLHQQSKSAEDSIWQIQTSLLRGRHSLGRDLLLSVAEDVYHIHEAAARLSQACKILDDDLCHDSNRWSDGDTPSDLESSKRLALHAELIAKLASEGRQCPICLEDMVDGTNNEPKITKCGHVFCEECIEIAIDEQQKCPMCRRGLPHSGYLFT